MRNYGTIFICNFVKLIYTKTLVFGKWLYLKNLMPVSIKNPVSKSSIGERNKSFNFFDFYGIYDISLA